MEKSVKANHRKIKEILRKNTRKLPEDSFARREDYAGKIEALADKVNEYCLHCEEVSDFQKMLLELAEDLPQNSNPPKAVHRSIQKRFKVIKNHLQGKHGLSFPNQFRDAGIVIGASLIGMAGFVVMAFNMIFLFPLAGLILGGIGGYFWGIKRDKRAEDEGKVVRWGQ